MIWPSAGSAMPDLVPQKLWWTAAEIAAAALPDLPATRQGVELLAKKMGWRTTVLARQRSGKGGGWEYGWELFPIHAKRALLKDAAAALPAPASGAGLGRAGLPAKVVDRADVWAWFERQTDKTKAEARARLTIVQTVEALVRTTCCTKQVAVATVAREHKLSDKTVWNYFALLQGVPSADRLPVLAPRHGAAEKRRSRVTVDPEFMARYKSDYLRPSEPASAAVYRRTVQWFEEHGLSAAIPPEWLVRRRYQASTSRFTELLLRKGEDALKAAYPAQTRDRSDLGALDWVVTDTHKWDVFVRFPLEHGERVPFIGRPQMIAFQDLSSNMVLSWRVDRTPNSAAVAAAAGDMIRDYGIPRHVLFDNGRENAAKWITGGAKSRYRFRVKDDDIPGLFTMLGTEIHWATPYSGQSKQIERTFRDFAQDVAKHPAFDGAYTGKSTADKPSDYGQRVVPMELFLEVVARAIHEWNSRADRRSEVAYGRSFADVFAEKYAAQPPLRATEEQCRLWLMGAEGIQTNRLSGVIRFRKNEYFAPWLGELAGERVVIRFDPTDLWEPGVHVYDLDGSYLGHAPCKRKVGYADMAEARAHAKARREFMGLVKKAAAAEVKYSALQLGADLLSITDMRSPSTDGKVVRAAFGKAAELRTAPEREETAADRVVENVVRASFEPRAPEPEVDDPWHAFRRVLEIEARLAAGEAVTPDQVRWAEGFKRTPKYKGQLAAYDLMGEAAFASG
jgi:putative transposase